MLGYILEMTVTLGPVIWKANIFSTYIYGLSSFILICQDHNSIDAW
jgi:hypothetical protein